MTTSQPPFNVPMGVMGLKLKPNGPWEQRTFPNGKSDGDSTKWPKMPPYRKSDSRNYLIRLAHAWAQQDGSFKEDTNYYLSELPAGYGTFEQDQPGGNQVYKRLFGHPSGKFYDSILKFETHFLWLLGGRQGECMCVNCGNHKPVPGPPRVRNKLDIAEKTPRAPKSAIRQDRPRLQTGVSTDGETSDSLRDVAPQRERRNRIIDSLPPVDEEGTFDVYKDALNKLFKQRGSSKGIELDLFEKGSIDWVAEEDIVQEHFTQIDLQHTFIPRRGELVLWCVSIPEEHNIYRDQNGMYKLYDLRKKRFVGHPKWRAGVVAAVPTAALKNEKTDFADILETPSKQTSLNTAGFRIETMPDPNDDTNKSFTKQYRYVPLQNIRPLSFWKFLLSGISETDLHKSISYALTCMTSVSIVRRTHLEGHWDREAYITAKGCYIGSELITVGDAVRLVPLSSTNKCTDILVVDSIRLMLQGLRQEHLKNDSQLLCRSSEIHFIGRAFTLDKSSSFVSAAQREHGTEPQKLSRDDIIATFRPVGTAKYGDWYPLHDMSKEFEVSYDQILGRLYEADALSLWTGIYQQKRSRDEQDRVRPDLAVDYEGILSGRRYATKADERIAELPSEDSNGIRWLLSDYRAQSLAVHTINGREIAAYHDIRKKETLREWHILACAHKNETPMVEVEVMARKKPNYKVGAVYDEVYSTQDSNAGQAPGKARGRPPGSKLIDGKVYTAEQLAQREINTEAIRTRPDCNEVLDLGEEDTDDQTPDHGRQPHFRSSQMANAGMNAADEDLMEEQDQFFDADESAIHGSLRRPLKSRLAMYGDEDDEDQDDNDDDEIEDGDGDENDDLEVDTVMEDVRPLNRQSDRPVQRAPLTKSQIMQSVENDDADALDDLQDNESEEDYLDMWTAPRFARGGTVESEGGDYRPGESQ